MKNKFIKPFIKSSIFYFIFTTISVITLMNNQILGLIAMMLLFFSIIPWCIGVLKPMVDKAWNKE